MFYKIVNNIVAINDTRLLQENRLKSDIHYFHIPFCRTLYRQKSFFPRPYSPRVEHPPCRYPVSPC